MTLGQFSVLTRAHLVLVCGKAHPAPEAANSGEAVATSLMLKTAATPADACHFVEITGLSSCHR